MMDDYTDFIAHLTDNARTSIFRANLMAQSFGSSYIGTEHLLLGVLGQGSSAGAKIMADAGITLEKVQNTLNMVPISVVINSEAKGFSETAKLTLKMSWDVAQTFHQQFLGTEHILYSLLGQKHSRAITILHDLGVNLPELIANLENFLSQQPEENTADNDATIDWRQKNTLSSRDALGVFGVDLTELAKQKKLDPVIGRADVEERLATIICRRTKNNPVLIGEPGVGKTAIVEGLAQKIVHEDVPEQLLDKKIIQIDLAGMIAGTKYRGEFEDRLKRIINEVKKRKDIILFIDELHLLVGAGSAEGSIDAANILKPALARGEIRLIGATTLDEYRRYIEKDSALTRRLQTIVVEEPSLTDSTAILQGLRKRYEKYHGVIISDEVIKTAISMSNRYINDRFMPDKAIDVIDEAAALVQVRSGVKPSKIKLLTKQIKELTEQMDQAVEKEDFEAAALYKTRLSKLSLDLKKMRNNFKQRSSIELTDDDIANAVALITRIPVNRIQKSEATLLKNLEKRLEKYIVGQNEAVQKIASAVRRSRSGISSDNRPIGSFVFLGPTGVGKTELAKVLAREVFGNENALIKIDMSEFAEKYTTSRLLGAPAGYIGYDDGGQLTDKVRRQPYSVVLFDEIEKAHRDVYNLLLQVLEDGTLTDSHGRKVNFTNTIIILTSNLGLEAMTKESNLGFMAKSMSDENKLEKLHDENAEIAKTELNNLLRPELINRFDEIVTFRALTRRQVNKIFDIQIQELQKRLDVQKIQIVVQPSAKKALVTKGYSESFGVRPMRRVIQDEIESRIADGLLAKKFNQGDVLTVEYCKKVINIKVLKEAREKQ